MGANARRLDLRNIVATYPDFPKPGIMFRDINPVFKRNDALNHIVEEFYSVYGKEGVDTIAGIESRGFIVATALALRFGKGVVMVRKAGKLPGKTLKKAYDIEYGSSIMELQETAIRKGESVLIADDLIATGGTAIAAAQLIEELGGKVAGFAFVIELTDLRGGDRLRNMGYKVQSLVTYHGE
ncbi:MAG TPA: adenine phosphoribosyltransferase [Nitrososphaera sp.]|nr:adenine phosphoribosyltransferase [Nitrososphaera sp.]